MGRLLRVRIYALKMPSEPEARPGEKVVFEHVTVVKQPDDSHLGGELEMLPAVVLNAKGQV